MKITELKIISKILKNISSLRSSSPLNVKKKRVSRLEDRLIKVIQFEDSREKRLRTTEQNFNDL